MAIGEFLGRLYNGYMGTDEDGNPSRQGMLAQGAGATFDYLNSRKQSEIDEQNAARALQQTQAIAQAQLNMAQQRAAEENAIRSGIVNRSQLLEQAINQARASLGPIPVASQQDINTNYNQIRDVMQGDLNKTIDRVSSQGFADAIARGMDRSDQFRDQQRDLSIGYADQLRKIDQEAYNAAINRTQQNQETLSAGRDIAYKEAGAGYQSAIDNLRGIMPTNAQSALNQAGTSQDRISSDLQALATDSQKASGTLQANLAEKYGGNLGYMLGKSDNYTNASAKKLAELEQQNADLNKRLKNAGIT